MRIPHPKHITFLSFSEEGIYGLQIGISNEVMEKLDQEDLLYLFFPTKTFTILKPGSSDEGFNTAFVPILYYFELLDVDTAVKIANFYITMHKIIHHASKISDDNGGKVSIDEANRFTSELSTTLGKLDRELDLASVLKKVVDDNIPIIMYDGGSNRNHDSHNMKFYREQIVDLTTMVLFCKLLAPIYGVFIDHFQKKMNSTLRELYCASIMQEVLENRYFELINRLRLYITKLVVPRMDKIDKKDGLTNAMKGFTSNMMIEQLIASLLNKNFATLDLYRDGCNLMSYVTYCARPGDQRYLSSASKTKIGKVEELKDPIEMVGEEGNTTIFEAESKRSSYTADIYTMVSFAANNLAIKELEYQESNWWMKDKSKVDEMKEAFRLATDYYQRHLIPPSRLAKFLMGIFYGKYIGGSAGIDNLSIKAESDLLALAQFRILYYGYPEVAMWCATTFETGAKTERSHMDNLLIQGWKNSTAYKHVMNRCPYALALKHWNTPIEESVKELTEHPGINNTAPSILNFIGSGIKPNREFIYDGQITTQLMEVVLLSINDISAIKF